MENLQKQDYYSLQRFFFEKNMQWPKLTIKFKKEIVQNVSYSK